MPQRGFGVRTCLATLSTGILLTLAPVRSTPSSSQAIAAVDEPRWESTDGRFENPLALAGKPLVILFLMTDCPIANIYAPEINRIVHDYTSKGVGFTIAYVDTQLSRKAAKSHADDHGFKCLAILDPSHSLAKRTGATVSPEAVVIDGGRQIVYRGRIDDRIADYGKARPKPKRRDLRASLDAVIGKRQVAVSRTKAIGCLFRAQK